MKSSQEILNFITKWKEEIIEHNFNENDESLHDNTEVIDAEINLLDVIERFITKGN